MNEEIAAEVGMDGNLADVAARELMCESFMKIGWCEPTLAFWLGHGCRCVYCGCDLTQSRDAAYYGSCKEHLLPKSKYPDLASSEWNKALACSSCNRLKGRWDPNEPDPVYNGEALNGEEVKILIDRAKRRIREQRERLEQRFQQEQSAIRNALRATR